MAKRCKYSLAVRARYTDALFIAESNHLYLLTRIIHKVFFGQLANCFYRQEIAARGHSYERNDFYEIEVMDTSICSGWVGVKDVGFGVGAIWWPIGLTPSYMAGAWSCMASNQETRLWHQNERGKNSNE